MSKTVAAIFSNYHFAENAALQVKKENLRTEDISIVTKDQNEQSHHQEMNATMGIKTSITNDNISDGVVTGGILGGIAGLLIGAGSMVIPGLGIVAAAGPITGLLSGALTGGVVGGLVDLGIPEKRGRQYETDIKAGKTLFSMKTEEDKIDRVAVILRDNGAESVDTY